MVMRTSLNVAFIRKLPVLYNIATYNTKVSWMQAIDIIVSHIFTSWSIMHWTEFVGVFETSTQLTIIKPDRAAQVDTTDTASRPANIRTHESFQTVIFSPFFGVSHSSLPSPTLRSETWRLSPSSLLQYHLQGQKFDITLTGFPRESSVRLVSFWWSDRRRYIISSKISWKMKAP